MEDRPRRVAQSVPSGGGIVYGGGRPGWDEFFLELARTASLRGTCDRKRVGAVISRENRALSLGYNGALPGMPHCDDPGVGHDMVDGHCVRVVHAEQNAIFHAARFGAKLEEATLYTLAYPCWPCFRAAAMVGIKRIVYIEKYNPDQRVEDAALRIPVLVEPFGGRLPILNRIGPEMLDMMDQIKKREP